MNCWNSTLLRLMGIKMKRRDLFKAILALPFASKAIAESFARTREVIAINVPPRTPQGATAYISGLYRSSKHSTIKYEEIIDNTPLGLKPVKPNPKIYTEEYLKERYQHYLISGEGKTKEEAWRRFWEDFDMQTVEWYNLGKSNKDIFWRRVVEEQKDVVFSDKETHELDFNNIVNYVISCRFSLGDFT